jgi:hypothetical protein
MSEDKACRDEFEAWFKSGHEEFNFHGTSAPTGWYYFDDDVDGAWSPWQAAWSRAAKPAVPEILFDGYAVLQAMSEKARARTSPENVSDVLDAAVKLIRAAAPPLPVAQGVPDLDEGMRDWVNNSLKRNSSELKGEATKARKAYTRGTYFASCQYIAEVYSKAAQVFESAIIAASTPPAAPKEPT